MNTYRTQFSCACPVNGDRIFYSLTIESTGRVMAEDIETAIEGLPNPSLHEEAADILAKDLPGRQTITAMHRAIHIETVRGEPEERRA